MLWMFRSEDAESGKVLISLKTCLIKHIGVVYYQESDDSISLNFIEKGYLYNAYKHKERILCK